MDEVETPSAVELLLMMEDNVPCIVGEFGEEAGGGSHPADIVIFWEHVNGDTECPFPPTPLCRQHWSYMDPESFMARLARASGVLKAIECGVCDAEIVVGRTQAVNVK